MGKERKVGISQEVMAKLGEEGYCFNQEHDKEIERLKGELATIEAKHKEELAKVTKDLEEVIMIKDDTMVLMERTNDDLKEGIQELSGRADQFVSQLASLKEDFYKEAKEKSACYDIFHRLLEGKCRVDITTLELSAFGAYLYLNDRDLSVSTITVFLPHHLKPVYDRAMKEGESILKKIAQESQKILEKSGAPPSMFGPMMTNKPRKS